MQDLFKEDIILEDSRARLEPLIPAHYDVLFAIAQHEILWTFTSAKAFTEGDFRKYFDEALKEKEAGTAYPFAIFDKQQDCYAGCTRFGNIVWQHKRLEIGWTWYHPAQQRTGLNRHCKKLLLTWAFETADFNRVELKTSSLNLKSQNAMLGIGAVKEGVLRKHMINDDGTLRDSIYFSFINDDWQETKSQYFKDYL